MTRLTCEDVLARMPAAMEQDGEARAIVEAHVTACASCARAWRDQQSVSAVLSHRVPASMSPAFMRQLESEVDRLTPWWQRIDWRWWSVRLAPVAALLVLLVGGTIGVTTTEETASESQVSSALWDGSASVSNDALLLAVLSGSPDDSLARYEGRSQ